MNLSKEVYQKAIENNLSYESLIELNEWFIKLRQLIEMIKETSEHDYRGDK